MKRFYLVSVLVLVAMYQPAHAGWMRTYGGDGSQSGGAVIPLEDSSYLVLGNNMGIWLLKVSQEGDTFWTKFYEGWGLSMDTTPDGGYIITGQRNDSLLLLKTDSECAEEWSLTYFHGGLSATGYSVCATSDGGYIIAGEHEKEEMNTDLWLVKTDADGNKIWERVLCGDNDAGQVCDWGSSVIETSDGGYAVCGSRGGWWGYNNAELWYLKTDASGNVEWNFSYDEGYSDKGRCIRETSDGGYIITGSTENMDFQISMLIVKLDASGLEEWVKLYSADSIGTIWAEGYWIEEIEDSCYIVVGYWNADNDDRGGDLWLLKLDQEGDTIWTRRYGEEYWEIGVCVRPDWDGGYIATGTIQYEEGNGDLYLLKTNANGDTLAISEDHIPYPSADFEVICPVGREITLRYANHPEGFHANIFNVTGRKVGELHNTESSGVVYWGQGQPTGVYFIVPQASDLIARKVVLVR